MANTQLRLYFARKAEQPKRGPAGLFICRNKGNKNTRLSTLATDRSLANYGASGSAWFTVRVSSGDGPSDAGRVYSELITGNTATNQSTVLRRIGGYLNDVYISSGGVVSAIAESAGVQLLQGDPPQPLQPTSEVVMYDPAAANLGLQTIATGPAGTFTDLASNGRKILWHRSDDTLGSRPIPTPATS